MYDVCMGIDGDKYLEVKLTIQSHLRNIVHFLFWMYSV